MQKSSCCSRSRSAASFSNTFSTLMSTLSSTRRTSASTFSSPFSLRAAARSAFAAALSASRMRSRLSRSSFFCCCLSRRTTLAMSPSTTNPTSLRIRCEFRSSSSSPSARCRLAASCCLMLSRLCSTRGFRRARSRASTSSRTCKSSWQLVRASATFCLHSIQHECDAQRSVALTGAERATSGPSDSSSRRRSTHSSQNQSPAGTSCSSGLAQYVCRALLQPSHMSSCSALSPPPQREHTTSSGGSEPSSSEL
mmetsp:Transcript_45868/g.107041  ORF Transcript_45868/g.107041 Transcript_45868/m.107041 type:complete len:253 (-) Transcript_45868:747-1505(-)